MAEVLRSDAAKKGLAQLASGLPATGATAQVSVFMLAKKRGWTFRAFTSAVAVATCMSGLAVLAPSSPAGAQAGSGVPTISNLPSAAVVGGSFIPTVTSNDYATTTLVESSTPSTCIVDNAGMVSFVGVGSCMLVANSYLPPHNIPFGSGPPQIVTVGQAGPSSPTISNLPSSAVVGDTFTVTATSNGDGPISVTSSSSSVCTVDDAGMVSFVGVGTCTLVAHVASGTNFLAADGSPQSFTVTSSGLRVTTLALSPSQVPSGRDYSAAALEWHSSSPMGRVVWKVTAGFLPRGLRLDAKTGVISGRINRNTYPRGQRFTFTVTGSGWDGLGRRGQLRLASAELSLDVVPY